MATLKPTIAWNLDKEVAITGIQLPYKQSEMFKESY